MNVSLPWWTAAILIFVLAMMWSAVAREIAGTARNGRPFVIALVAFAVIVGIVVGHLIAEA